ncbi:MAG TPA: hypothetical protein VHW45_09865, partial [Candidatus Sulfotelmatobacter sp.]|nr:hypothetical protein [Candidatus Sulfotelmatobacter sp.]
MGVPLRNNQQEFEGAKLEEEEITTADLAQGKRPGSETRGPQAVATDRSSRPNIDVQEVQESAPLFPASELDGLRTRWQAIQISFV